MSPLDSTYQKIIHSKHYHVHLMTIKLLLWLLEQICWHNFFYVRAIYHIMKTGLFWLCLLGIFAAGMIPRFTMKALTEYFMPNDIQISRELEKFGNFNDFTGTEISMSTFSETHPGFIRWCFVLQNFLFLLIFVCILVYSFCCWSVFLAGCKLVTYPKWYISLSCVYLFNSFFFFFLKKWELGSYHKLDINIPIASLLPVVHSDSWSCFSSQACLAAVSWLCNPVAPSWVLCSSIVLSVSFHDDLGGETLYNM